MTYKVYYCYKCKGVYKNPEDIICPKCGIVCKKFDFIPKEDMPAYMEDLRNDHAKVTSFRSVDSEKKKRNEKD